MEGTSFMHWKGSPDIAPFLDYLIELGALRFSGVRPHSLDMHYNEGIEICHIMRGTHTWEVEGEPHCLYPGDGFITCPWQQHGNPEGIHERGFLAWLILKPQLFEPNGNIELGKWSRLDTATQREIGRVFASNTDPVIPRGVNIMEIFRQIDDELVNKEIGYGATVDLLLDSLLIKVARALLGRGGNRGRDEIFHRELNDYLLHRVQEKFSVDELAYSFDMSASTFTRRVKTLTGFSPGDYLLELKLSRAKELLVDTDEMITSISMECGFSSSQYFAKIFAKRTGMTPSFYRIKNRGC